MAALRCVFTAVIQGQPTYFLFKQVKASPLLTSHNICSRLSSASYNHTEAPANSSSGNSQSSSTVTSPRANPVSLNDDYAVAFDPSLVNSLIQNMKGDQPLSEMPDPFDKNYRRCFLCKQNVQLDHKNVRLLSQFVSPYTGRIYGRAVTGLCIPMQKHVAKLIKRSRQSGYMPFIMKDPKYLQDPQAFDPMSRRNN